MTQAELNVLIRRALRNRAVAILWNHGPMRCSDLGWQLWGDTTAFPDRGGRNKFSRPAGKLLRELERDGRVTWIPQRGHCLWHAIGSTQTRPASE